MDREEQSPTKVSKRLRINRLLKEKLNISNIKDMTIGESLLQDVGSAPCPFSSALSSPLNEKPGNFEDRFTKFQ